MDVHQKELSNTLSKIQNLTIKELERTIASNINNRNPSLIRKIDPTQIKSKIGELNLKLVKKIRKEKPIECFIPKTDCLIADALIELEKQVEITEKSLNHMKQQLANITRECNEYKDRRDGLKKMRRIQLENLRKRTNSVCELEFREINRLFKETKDDLYNVVDTLYPENDGFKEFLGTLTKAFSKGGDEMYVKVTPQTGPLVSLMLEADLIVHHRNDKKKVRMVDLV